MVTEVIDIQVRDGQAVRGAKTIKGGLDGIGVAALRSASNVDILKLALAGLRTVGAFNALRAAVRSFAGFNRGLTGVGKTTNLTGSALDSLSKELRRISREVPVATGELLGIAETAGQLGVTGVSNISKFTKTVAQLGLATDLAGETAATTLARILTVIGTAISDVDRFGSTLVALGNQFAATESEIAAAAIRVARSTAAFSTSAAETAGIATALRAVGLEAEEGGSVVGHAFSAINKAVREGGAELQALSRITGDTGDELRQSFDRSSTQVFRVRRCAQGPKTPEFGLILRLWSAPERSLAKLGPKYREVRYVFLKEDAAGFASADPSLEARIPAEAILRVHFATGHGYAALIRIEAVAERRGVRVFQ